MSTAGAFDTTPVEHKSQLIGWMAEGAKAKSDWRIGVEHEKFCFRLSDHAPLPFDGDGPSISKVLEAFADLGWEKLNEDGRLVGLALDGATIALEPGGQFELSGAPLETIHQTCNEVNTHLAQARTIGDQMGAGFLGLGAAPTWSLADMPRIPKARYDIMRAYMPKVGRLGHEMMHRTCTVQVNLDFSSEADMVKKLRVALSLQPLATALFANSPFIDGRPNGWKSYRAHVWSDTDPDRTGMLPFAFDEGFGFEQYVDWAMATPMYFLRRDGRFVDVAGTPFSALFSGHMSDRPGERACLGDWIDHTSTLFPEARVKRFIEVRGADGGPWGRLCALPALWVGLLYDQTALDGAWELARHWTAADRDALRLSAPMLGLDAPIAGRTLQDVAKDALALARQGLKARHELGCAGDDESGFLDELDEIAESGISPAERLVQEYHQDWGGDLSRIFSAHAY